MLDEMAAVPGVHGVMMTFDDFVIGMEQFGTRIMPLMRCRDKTREGGVMASTHVQAWTMADPATQRWRRPSPTRTRPRGMPGRSPPRVPAGWCRGCRSLPLTAILVVMFALPTMLFLVVSFFDYDRTGIYPAFLLDSYREIFTSASTLRVYASTLKFALIVWAITLFLGFNIAYFLIFHVRSGTIRDGLVPALRHPVLHLRHHPHHRLDPVPRPLRRLQPDRDGARPRPRGRSTSCCSPTSPSSSPTCISTRC